MLNVIVLSVAIYYVECHYAECHYAECRGAKYLTRVKKSAHFSLVKH